MILNRIYYLVKAILPWQVRIGLRRLRAAKRLRAYADVWPIDPNAGATPPQWPGWPGSKSFAIILSHDVEGARGEQRVDQLMNLEAKYGFRSSFNFVPEGEYQVTSNLRDRLDQAGFEIGVHGLRHDGKLYTSKEEFGAQASQIREYLRNWNASGFRSPFMQHNLSWLHQLQAEYDSSTFDTDPFEPEPDGVATIFPFWVPDGNGGGYVELPYTLIQDFNLFVVLRAQNIDFWKRKLDWVATHGGMVLLNTHPDYMCFEGPQTRDEFPVGLYEEFLAYARQRYEGAFWTGTPRDAARYYRGALQPAARNTRRRVCMLTYSIYETDNRVRRYAESLARRGDFVDVIALSAGPVPPGPEKINGVTVHHIQQRERNERSKWTYLWRLLRFLSVSCCFLTGRHHRIRYDLVHVHNIPDFLVFAACFPKWTGAKVILDIHDIVPELFANKFRSKLGAAYLWLLKKIEKASTTFADHVIISNDLWLKTLVSRSAPAEKCSVFLNHVDSQTFYRRPRTRNDGKVIVLFHGSFQWHQGLDIAIEAFARFKQKVPNAELHLYGNGNAMADLVHQVDRLNLKESVKFLGSVSLDRIPDIIANADLGVVPKRADSFGNEAYSTKIMEFMSQGVPVIASRTKIDSFYFSESVLRFFPAGDSAALAEAMLEVIERKDIREALISNGLQYAARNSWDLREKEYLALVDSMLTEAFSSSPGLIEEHHHTVP